MLEHDEVGNGERGTLVWIGPSNLGICRSAFRFCADRFPQVAVRRSLEHCLAFPAQYVSDVVVVRQNRSLPESLNDLQKFYPTSRFWAMSASGCEGEQRTGTPWPGFHHFYWHQWNQVMPQWFCTHTYETPRPQAVRIITTAQQTAEALASGLAARGHSVVIQRPPRKLSRQVRTEAYDRFDTVIWDDSAAPAASAQVWRRRLRWAANYGPITTSEQASAKHIWMCSFPRIEDWLVAETAGVHSLLSKPCHSRVWNAIHD